MSEQRGLSEEVATFLVIKAEIRVHFQWGKSQMNTICFSAPSVWESTPRNKQEEMIRARFESHVKEHPYDFIFPVDRVEVVSFRSGADIVTFESIGPYPCPVLA